MKKLLMLVTLVLTVGCDREEDVSRSPTSILADAAPGPIMNPDPQCENGMPGGTIAAPTWAAATLASCLEPSAAILSSADGFHLYDSCESAGWTPGACLPIPFGTKTCSDNRWTAFCWTDSDCPGGARCDKVDASFGFCVLTCDPALGDVACGRCDLMCAGGECVGNPYAPLGAGAVPCTADCECMTGKCTLYGYCHPVLSGEPAGRCDINCPCVGGTCDSRGCCIAPDGTIDNGDGPLCNPSP